MRPILALPLALSAALPAGAAPPGEKPWFDMVTADGMVTSVAEYALLSARAVADLTYDDLSVDTRGQRIVLSGLRLGAMAGLPGCTIAAESVEVGPGIAGGQYDGRIAISGLNASAGCLRGAAAMSLAAAGLREVRVPQAVIDMHYQSPASRGVILTDIEVEGLGHISLTAEAEGLHLSGVTPEASPTPTPDPLQNQTPEQMPAEGPDLASERPAGRLVSLRASFEDAGAVAAFSPMLPAEFLAPEGADAAIAGALSALLPQGTAAAIGAELAQFLKQPGRIEAQILPPEPLPFGGPDSAAETQAILAALVVAPALPPAHEVLPAGLLKRVLVMDGTASLEDRRKVALALIRGEGAPPDVDSGAALLAPDEQDGEVLLALGAAYADRNPRAAWDYAQGAAAAGLAAAPALLDRLEARLGLPATLAALPPVPEAYDLTPYRSAEDFRAAAIAAWRGQGEARDQARAVALAGIAASLGDRAAVTLRARIAGGMARLIDPAPWQRRRAEAERAALMGWISADMPAMLAEP